MKADYVISISSNADREMSQIREYITDKLDAPKVAEKKLRRIMKAIRSLAVFPEMHRVRRKDAIGREIRYFPVDDYIVLYSVDEEKLVVNILHVYHTKRNIDKLI